MRTLLAPALIALATVATAAVPNTLTPAEKAGGWHLLFDGKSLSDWKPSGPADAFKVEDGCIVADRQKGFLHYAGPVEKANFRNFDLVMDVKTLPKANSGVFFHAEWQDNGRRPMKGYEVQINASHKDPKRTASLYGIQDNLDPLVPDETWYTLRIRVEGKRIQTFVNDRKIVDYTEEAQPVRPKQFKERLVGSGTFVLQGHDPESKIYFRNIKVKALP